CSLGTLAQRFDRELGRQFIELRQQLRRKREPVALAIDTTLRPLLAGQANTLSWQRFSIAHLPDVPVDFRLELIERLKSARIEREHKPASIGDFVRFSVEIDAVATKQCTVERPGE